MGLGDLLGKAASALGGQDEILSQIGESGIDLSALTDLDPEQIMAMLEENGIDLTMFEGVGISVEDMIEKVKA